MHSETILGFKRVRACMFGGFAKFVPLKLQANRRESVRILVANLSVFQCIAAALPDMLHISLVIWTNLKVPRWERGSQKQKFKTQEGFTCLCPCCREEYHCIPNLWQAAKNLISFELKKKKKKTSVDTRAPTPSFSSHGTFLPGKMSCTDLRPRSRENILGHNGDARTHTHAHTHRTAAWQASTCPE